MRLKRANAGARVCALASFVLLSALALTPAPAPALALHEGRVYEMVSPVYKGGYEVRSPISAVAPDGESVAFGSLGGFAGVPGGAGIGALSYLARRGPSGWSTVPVQPAFGLTTDFSASLEYTLAIETLGPNFGAANYEGTEQEFLLHRNDTPDTAAGWEVAGGIVMKLVDEKRLQGVEEGASADLCHIVVGRTGGPLLRAAVKTDEQIYDLARGCGGEEPSLRLVGLNNSGRVINRECPVELGVGTIYSGTAIAISRESSSDFNAIAAGGSEMFFTTDVEAGSSTCGERIHQLFVRLGGSRTLEVSKPISESCGEVPCEKATKRASAYFRAASEDGSRVFFTTTAPLASEDKDTGNDLYMARIGCPGGEAEGCEVAQKQVTSVVQVSHAPSGEPAEVQGVVKVARDGSRVYFLARGVLSTGANAQGEAPVKGADNLYVYDSTPGTLAFVADLCSGPELSGAIEDVRCPHNLEAGGVSNDTGLWGGSPEAQTAGRDGRFLVFSTYAQLVKNDTDNAKDVYRYDAETGALDRVSIGEGGYGANGNGNDTAEEPTKFDATIVSGNIGNSARVEDQYEMHARAISEDGSRIVFSTAGPLSPDATNGRLNIYEWHEGSVSLVSSGNGEGNVGNAVISASGRDIFFLTTQGLVPQDTDGLFDIYDARMGGGFPLAPAPRQPCSSDACQGALSTPAPLLVPGSVSQAPGGNFAAPPSKPTPSVKKATPKCPKGKKLSHGKCVKTKKAKAKKANKSGHRRGR